MNRVFFQKNKYGFGALAGLIFLQTIILNLYGVDAEPILYLCALELFFFAVFTAISYFVFYQKYQTLRKMRDTIESSIERLPDFNEPMERELKELLLAYDRVYRRSKNEIVQEKQEMADYYVLWTHQIKTPITSARLLLQAGEHPQNAELNAELFRIEQYVQMALCYVQMNEMHNDLLIRECNIDNCIKGALKKFAREFIRRKLTVTYEELNQTVMTDEKWLGFVIEQILSNACKYTKTGGVTIYAEGGELVIADTGIGIRAEDLPRIFDKGFTGYNGRADKKSTGIGLYLCRRIMQNLSFDIRAESELGKGTQLRLGIFAKET